MIVVEFDETATVVLRAGRADPEHQQSEHEQGRRDAPAPGRPSG